MKIYIQLTLLWLTLLSSNASKPASAQSVEQWYLPLTISDQNTQVSFELETTWHDVEGRTKGLKGRAWLADPKDPQQVQVELELPVASFDTDSSSRDKTLREVMHAKKFPSVVFKATRLTEGCNPQAVLADPCKDNLAGSLRIRDVEKNVQVPVGISSEASGFIVRGSLPIKWEEYGVEDPSIFLIASVDPVVKINFEVKLLKPTQN